MFLFQTSVVLEKFQSLLSAAPDYAEDQRYAQLSAETPHYLRSDHIFLRIALLSCEFMSFIVLKQ